MRIIDNSKKDKVPFNTLNNGDVFEWEGDYYIVTMGQEMVRLKDGQPDGLDLDTPVRPVNATLTIS